MYEALLYVATFFSLMSGGVLAVVSTIDKLYDLKEKAHKRPGDHEMDYFNCFVCIGRWYHMVNRSQG